MNTARFEGNSPTLEQILKAAYLMTETDIRACKIVRDRRKARNEFLSKQTTETEIEKVSEKEL